jgi:hypothetical protein
MSNNVIPQLQGKARNIVFAIVAFCVAIPLWYFFFTMRDMLSMIIAFILSLMGIFFLYRAFDGE